MITLFVNDYEIYESESIVPYASSFVKFNLPCFAALILYGGPNSVEYYYCLRE